MGLRETTTLLGGVGGGEGVGVGGGEGVGVRTSMAACRRAMRSLSLSSTSSSSSSDSWETDRLYRTVHTCILCVVYSNIINLVGSTVHTHTHTHTHIWQAPVYIVYLHVQYNVSGSAMHRVAYLLHLLHELLLAAGEGGRGPLFGQTLVSRALPQLLQQHRVGQQAVWGHRVRGVKGRQRREEFVARSTAIRRVWRKQSVETQ